MGYTLQLHQDLVVPYLQEMELSRGGRVVLYTMLDREFREQHGDRYRSELDRRVASGSDLFQVDFVFRDPETARFHNVRFILSDASAEYGILQVVYVDSTASA